VRAVLRLPAAGLTARRTASTAKYAKYAKYGDDELQVNDKGVLVAVHPWLASAVTYLALLAYLAVDVVAVDVPSSLTRPLGARIVRGVRG
jgi:hypothetical protein